MPTPQEDANIKLVIHAMDLIFNKRDYEAAKKLWSPDYVQRSLFVPPGKDGLFDFLKTLPDGMKWESDIAVANDDVVFVHTRLQGPGKPPFIAGDWFRIKDGQFVEHWDVMHDEVTEAQSLSKRPMFGESFSK
jgi:predicted SnoaL-like aldol condensation-catalyzing enzyme